MIIIAFPKHYPARGGIFLPRAGDSAYNHLTTFMLAKLVSFFHPNRVFPVLVAYRWASLLPAILLFADNFYTNSPGFLSPIGALAVAGLANTIITLFNRLLNKLVTGYPLAIGIDLLFCGAMLAMSGGSHSPYYLYALSPLLAGAFFFQARGAITASLVFTPLYVLASILSVEVNTTVDSIALMTQLVGLWLIPILFAYPSILLQDISKAREGLARARDDLVQQHGNLETAHRQLEIIHDLTVLLQAAPDLFSVQERVLGAVTTDLGFSKSVVALVDPALEELGGWLVHPTDQSFPSSKPLPLNAENGELFKALLNRTAFRTNGEILVQETELNSWLNQTKWLVIPLYLREHPVGLLLVDEADRLSKEKESILMTVANQAALALGTTLLCIDRARRLAIETERNRIARDIHDTVAQSLFGIVYSLDACINMLPRQADEVKKELIELRSLASTAHDEVRRSIFDLWPSPLTIDLLVSDLTNYVSSCCRPRSFSIIFNNSGDFNLLSAGLRRTIYRMAQEALANSARHSGANCARLCLNVSDDYVYLDISDEGRGFDPSTTLSRSLNREHFGLHGIQERARAMGGECEILSRNRGGTRIMIVLPIQGHSSRV